MARVVTRCRSSTSTSPTRPRRACWRRRRSVRAGHGRRPTGTFKAFAMDATKGLVVLPFAGWDYDLRVQQRPPADRIHADAVSPTAGTAHTKGWVERGIFVGNRLVSLSDLSLAVDRLLRSDEPVDGHRAARSRATSSRRSRRTSTIAEMSSDWWGNDVVDAPRCACCRSRAPRRRPTPAPCRRSICRGVAPQVFTNGGVTYVVTSVQVQTQCPTDPTQQCAARQEQVEVLDLTGATPCRAGSIQLPSDSWGWYGWGWYGFFW